MESAISLVSGRIPNGKRRVAARLDAHSWGPWILWQTAHWCACGSPWDLDATPNFTRMIEVNEVPWPPVSSGQYPLKDW